MSKFYYFWQHWEEADMEKLDAKSWEECPAAWMRANANSDFHPDQVIFYEVVEVRTLSIKGELEKLKKERAKKAKEQERLNKEKLYEDLKKELGK